MSCLAAASMSRVKRDTFMQIRQEVLSLGEEQKNARISRTKAVAATTAQTASGKQLIQAE